MTKRIFAAIVALALVLGMFGTSVFAADGENIEPKAEVTRLEALTLTQAEHDYMCWPNGDDTVDRPLEIVVNFKALETAEEVTYSPWKQWKVDFYLTLEDLSGDSITADNCYLAGNYGTFGWIVIPTDGLELEEGVTYPIVSAYDANITYKQICESVKDFTSAIHIDQAILDANPDMKVKLELKITNPEDENQKFVIGDPLVYTFDDLKNEEEAPKEYIIYGSRMTLGNTLEIDFSIVPRLVEDTDRIVINQMRADGKIVTVEKTVAEIKNVVVDGFYEATIGVAAKEMADSVEITVYDASGKVKDSYTESVRGYAMKVLKNTNDSKLKTVVVDMLNYGAKAQEYFKYNVTDFANNQLTEEQKKFASDEAELDDNYQGSETSLGSSLMLKSNITLTSYFKKPADINGMYATVEYTNHNDKNKEFTIDSSEFDTQYSSQLIGIETSTLVVADISQIVSINVYNADGTLYGSAKDSIESYIAYARTADTEEVSIANELAKFALASYNYFHK